MSPMDPDALHYSYRSMLLTTEYSEMSYLYSYFRFVVAAEDGLMAPIDNDPGYDFEANYVDALR